MRYTARLFKPAAVAIVPKTAAANPPAAFIGLRYKATKALQHNNMTWLNGPAIMAQQTHDFRNETAQDYVARIQTELDQQNIGDDFIVKLAT